MDVNTVILLILTGLLAGVLGGLMGVGGGIVVIPALVYIFGTSQQTAQGTSLAFMLAPVGIFAFINYYKAGFVNVKFAVIIALAFMVGSYFSSKWAVTMNADTMKKVFGVFIILVGIKMLLGK